MKSYSQYCGQTILICYDLTVFLHLLISLNRMCAIFLPLRYNKIFSYDHTMIAIVFVFVLEISSSIYFYDIQTCRLFYADDFYHFVFTTEPICLFIAWYTDFMRNVSIVIIIVTLDIVTVTKVHIARKTMSEMITSETAKRRRDQEVNFLRQACLQAIVFVLELITYFVLEPKFENKWMKFFLTTVAWVGVHCIDGFITILFNREFRVLIPCLKGITTIGPTETLFTTSSSRMHFNQRVDSRGHPPTTAEIYGA
ncbi:hypothetical protein WR25_02155 [Diploscapter pachys]|uniref:G-protein coupled receptors family 1 profile domain-containing protein n=1 Tax=Diploscapter pachys TaxID=2018661 RepID=A0A2A2KMK8_9BILA|nr:hypothetical protein WR25_02155 [Diploscapter pachys]